MKKVWIGKLNWLRKKNWTGYDADLYLFTDNGEYRAKLLIDQFAGKTVKITIEVLDDEDVAL